MPTTEEPWLVYDRRDELGDRPGTHAVIIGVSRYPFITDEVAAEFNIKIGDVPSAARSSMTFFRWLLKNADRLTQPLKTIRILISPTDAEADEAEELKLQSSDCTFDEFGSVMYGWREDASRRPEDTVIFYFCGNGFDVGSAELVLALSDFGRKRTHALYASVAVNHIVQGLAPSERLPNIARTQLYFIDTGRRHVNIDPTYLSSTVLFDLFPPSTDDRHMAICHSSSPGEKAYGLKSGTTVFLSALMRCLDGEAAVRDEDDFERPREKSAWRVTVDSLARRLNATLQLVSEEVHAPPQNAFVIRTSGDMELVRLKEAPMVSVCVAFASPEAARSAVIAVHDSAGTAAEISEGDAPPSERRFMLRAGFYSVRISLASEAPDDGDAQPHVVNFITSLEPPRAVWQIEEQR